MKKYILALDEGTTSARSILFDRGGNIVAMAQQEINQIYPEPGWVEQDPIEIYASQYASMTECIAKSGVDPNEIAGIGITNQRETTIVWNKKTGRPICNAIVWQCRRTVDECIRLEENGLSEMILEKTGLRPDAYFSATKIKWILENVVDKANSSDEDESKKIDLDDLLFGTVDSWLIWKLTDGKIHVTDRTNASRTMLYNINEDAWDEELLELFDIPKSMLPEVKSSSEIYGNINIMGADIPVCGIAGDQQAALFGQCCFSEGDIKNTYGTGCFLLANTGNKRVDSESGMITTLAATEKGAPLEYVLEGSVFVGGAVIKWLRDELRFITDASDSEYFATKIKDNGGVYIVPAFTGLGAPYWDMYARGTITGLTRGAGRDHIIRAALEAIAYQSDDLIRSISKDIGKEITELRVDGGASANNFLMQFQADISNLTVCRPAQREATAAGAAYLAGLACGFYKNREEILALQRLEHTFVSDMSEEERNHLTSGWQRAVRACRAEAEEF